MRTSVLGSNKYKVSSSDDYVDYSVIGLNYNDISFLKARNENKKNSFREKSFDKDFWTEEEYLEEF